MKFLCLAYYDVEKFRKMDKAALREMVERCSRHDEALRATGRVETIVSLSMPEDWKTIRPPARGEVGGRPRIMDGPFAEGKEVIGSFFIIEAEDDAEAVEIASKHPAAQMGEELGFAVEVRPYGTCKARELTEA